MGSRQNAKLLLGEAGEHLVLSRLHQHGYVASQAPRAWKADDVLVREGPTLQVKSTDKGTKVGWMVGDIKPDDNRWYALVDLRDGATVYVLPSAVARMAADAGALAYGLVHPGTRDSGIRKLHDPWPKGLQMPDPFGDGWLRQYSEAWHLLPTPAEA